ncbi:TIGR04063 family PEP-CTERM/XrtA system glycosyltransferase [Govanella unica]|uniref:Glycosyltransferase, exosortase A system-associated n=1 Tax=Govanella unica TaxID=2975056 RepID=A0A9X3TXV0_9PROT|nr:TIGR04063 family PEP-CTERM/XrtA system glycosyltransferase [Govania unica]MDA5193584.1 glycosyltransferase, exosortase A system-associated [Govania unica]
MRILHVFDHSIPLHSGYTFRSYGILTEQHRRGWDTVHVTTPRHVKPGPLIEDVDGLRFYRTPAPTGFATHVPVLRELAEIQATTRRLDEVIAETKPDIIHAHSPVLNALAALPAARRAGLPFVYEIRAFWEDASAAHGTSREGDLRFRATKFLETRAARKADAVTVICEGLKSDLITRGIPADKITIIPNAVDLSKFSGVKPHDTALAHELGLDGADVLGFIGSFYDYEGLDTLLRALPLIRQDLPKARLVLVGGGPEEQRLKALTTDMGLDDMVLFTGRVPHQEVDRYYSLVDLFIYPRKSMRLTDLVTPLKPLEAMAEMKMVAASDVGGHKELITDGVNGHLFKADDPQDLARTVARIFADRANWPAQLDRARRYVETERTWTQSVANYEQVYPKLLKKA